MSDTHVATDAEFTSESADTKCKETAKIAYIIMLAGLVVPFAWLAGAIVFMVKKSDAIGTKFEDHFHAMTKVFWVGLGLNIVGFILSFVVVGYFLMLGVYIWSAYKAIKGFIRLNDGKPFHD